MWFKTMNSIEYEKLIKRLLELESRIAMCETYQKSQELENKLLRDKVLRKIQSGKDNPYDKSQDLNNPFSPFKL